MDKVQRKIQCFLYLWGST